MKKIVFFLSLVVVALCCNAQTRHDFQGCNVHDFFCNTDMKYVISYHHDFKDTLKLPLNCVIMFDGGSLCGPIVMNNTELLGNVKLKGSRLKGKVKNKQFDASWICNMDGVNDDAYTINEMIDVCGHVFFPKGDYRLISAYDTEGKVNKKLRRSIKAHIGINKSDVYLVGESGARFITSDSLGTICLFSKPNRIDKSIGDVRIEGLTFKVENDGNHFHEFLHTIKTIGVNGLTIENCVFDDFWGDAICLSHFGDNPKTGERTLNQNVNVLNNSINGNRHNNRNGISVISGKNVLIKGNTIKNTSRKDMPGGIDVEPNNSAYTIENIRIEGNYLEGITGTGGAISIQSYKDGPAHHIEILSNEIKNCSKAGIAIRIKSEGTTDSFIIKDNYIHADTRPFFFRGNGMSKDWTISGNTFGRPILKSIPGEIAVENLVVRNNKKKE